MSRRHSASDLLVVVKRGTTETASDRSRVDSEEEGLAGYGKLIW